MTWQEFYNQYINMEPGIVAIALRLLCAMIVGSLVGLEREYTHRPAGLRTHILVALGACVASLMGQMLFAQYGGVFRISGNAFDSADEQFPERTDVCICFRENTQRDDSFSRRSEFFCRF